MKNYKKLFITLLCLGMLCTAHAENIGIASGKGTQNDPWIMNGTTATVECPKWMSYYVQFTPTADGTVMLKAEGKSGNYWFNGTFGGNLTSTPQTHSVQANETYTVRFNPSGASAETKLTITLATEVQKLEVVEYGWEPGSIYGISSQKAIKFLFNEEPAFDEAVLIKDNDTVTIATNPARPNEVALDQAATDNALLTWLGEGKFDSDSTFTVKITGLHKAADAENLYGEDGVLSVDYKCNKPVRCLTDECVLPKPLLSYYKPGNPKGIVKIAFDGELKNDSVAGTVEFNRGATNAEDVTYIERIKGYAEGDTVTFDLTGKLRHSTLMTPSQMKPGTMDMRVGPVYAKDGNLTYTGNSGNVGTYTFTVPFEELNTEIISDFPESLTGDNLEIWIKPIADIEYTGVAFAYTAADGSAKNDTVQAVEAADPADETAATLTVQIPEGVKTAKEGTTITVSLANVSCIDGIDHSNELSKEYGDVTGKGTQDNPWVMHAMTATVEAEDMFGENYYYLQFTPTADGTVTFTAESAQINCWLNEGESFRLFKAEGPQSQSVKAHMLYTLKFNGENPKLTVTLATEVQTLEVVEYGWEPGSVYGISSQKAISFLFNEEPAFDEVLLVKDNDTVTIATNPARPKEVALDQAATDNALLTWLGEGKFDSDSTFTVKITGLHKAADAESLYGEEGVLSVDYKCNKPVRCLTDECVLPKPLLSYYKPGNPKGIVKIVFDGELKNDSVVGSVEFNRNTEIDGVTYIEEIKGYAEGDTVTFDLTGKLRHSSLMTPSQTKPAEIQIVVGPVYAKDGNLTYTSTSGSPGTYTFTVPFEELNTEIISDFPESLTGDNLEIWIKPIADIEYTGVAFAYTAADGSAKTDTVQAVEAADPVDEEAATLTVQIPEGVKTAKEGTTITVSLAGLSCIDGIDHSNELTARYNSDGTSSLSETTAADKGITVYNLHGILVLKADNADALRTLERGAYIVNGKVLIIK